jgi:2'-5' RNA ligase
MAGERAAPGESTLRLFAAIEIPEPAKDAVWEAVAPFRDRFPGARWVPRENWHVTMKFLGATRRGLVEWVEQRMEATAAAHAPFETGMRGLGAFPSARRARVVWAGLDDDEGAMGRLAGALDAALAAEFAPESRAFHPHLTVARSDPPLALPGEFADTALEGDGFATTSLTLFRSHLRRPAPRYERLATFALRG